MERITVRLPDEFLVAMRYLSVNQSRLIRTALKHWLEKHENMNLADIRQKYINKEKYCD